MSQKKHHSLLETCLGTAIGFIIAVLTQILVFPIFDLEPSFMDNVGIALIFTIVSIIRGYYVRRFFNHLHVKGILQ